MFMLNMQRYYFPNTQVVVIQSFNPLPLQTHDFAHDVNILEISIFIVFTESVMHYFRIASFPYKFFLDFG